MITVFLLALFHVTNVVIALKALYKDAILSHVFDCSLPYFCRESHPQKEEEKTVVSSARLLRMRFQRPKPNLRATSRKEVLDVNSKSALCKDTNKEESLTQCDSECSIPPDTDVRLLFFTFSYM